ncbi:poly(A)-binding protein binding protein [Malassezia brasiliensis]|uniref:Poly(A)-binding protein binding protein n=1 Tax=Malassezia brasiliensis TaxID=1821822 RepID=A0AAF0INR7_9BASI|nr:poly(A)-binding protein binding protein [Malassezia brasiliensis]
MTSTTHTSGSGAQRRASNAGHAGRGRGQHAPLGRWSAVASGGTPHAGANAARTTPAGRPKGKGDAMRERVVALLAMLVGQMVVVTLVSGERYVGVLSAAHTEASPLGVVLSVAQRLSTDGRVAGEPVASLVIAGADLAEVDATNAVLSTAEDLDALQQHVTKAKPVSGFRTDTEISQAARTDGRTLQRWDDAGEAPETTGLESGTLPSAQGWDQFAANEARFGIKSDYEETMYTTKLDRSAKDFKQREREADRIAREILEQNTDNVHVAEERNQVEAHDRNEEDKYGAVVRGANAYVPPAARTGAEEAPAPAAPSVASSASAPSTAAPETTAAAAAPAPTAAPAASARTKPEAPSAAQGNKALTSDFRQFVSAERERLVVRKAELAQKEKQNRLTDLKAWAQSFRLKTPVPDDMPDLKGPAKKGDAKSAKPAAKPTSKLSATSRAFNPTAAAFTPGAARAAPAPIAGPSAAPPAVPSPAMPAAVPAPAPGAPMWPGAMPSPVPVPMPVPMPGTPGTMPSPAAVPMPAAAPPPPVPAGEGGATPTPPSTSATPASSAPAHPFFGTRTLKTGSSSRVMDDFRPSKNKKLPEAPTVTAWWPYNGRPFRQQVAMSVMPVSGGVPVGMPPMMPPMVGMFPNGKSPRPMQQEPRTPLGMPPQPGTPGDQPGYALMYAPYGQYRFPGQPYFPPEAMQHAGMYGALSPPPMVQQMSPYPGQAPYAMPNAYMPRPAPGVSPHVGKRQAQGSEPKAAPAHSGSARDASAGGRPTAGRAEGGAGRAEGASRAESGAGS